MTANKGLSLRGAQRRSNLVPPEKKLPPRPKESAQEVAGGAFGDATVDLRAVVAGRLVEDPRAVLDPAAFRIVGGKIEPADPRQADRRGAHRAGLQRHVEIAAGEPLCAEPRGTFAQHQHLGMRGRVVVALDPVAGSGDDVPGDVDQHGADRHLARAAGRDSLIKGARHRAITALRGLPYLVVAHGILAPRQFGPIDDTARYRSTATRGPRADRSRTHRKGDGARRAVLPARRRALDR